MKDRQPLQNKFLMGVDFILGNHEYHHDVNKVLDELKQNTPMNILVNSNIQIMGGKQPVYIAGVAYDNDREKKNVKL